MHSDDTANQRYKALMLAGIFLPFLLVTFLEVLLLHKGQNFGSMFLLSRFILWATLGLMFLFARYGEVQGFFLWDDEGYGFGFYLKWIILLYLLCVSAGIISSIPNHLGVPKNNFMFQKMQLAFFQYPGLGLFTAATAGITEEFFFRGYMISRLSLFFQNRHYPVLVSTALFSAIHIVYHDISELVFTFLFGLTFGYHYQRYRNIAVLVIVHTIVDIIAAQALQNRH